MVGKVTKASVAEYAKETELIPYEIDGIPEGFSWFRDKQITADGLTVVGYILVFVPLEDWKNALLMKPIVHKQDASQEEVNNETNKQKEEILKLYNEQMKKYGK